MNISMDRARYESLPFRDDTIGPYLGGKMYRARAHPGLVFKFCGPQHRPHWECYQVDLT